MYYLDYLERQAKEQLEMAGRIDMSLAYEMMAAGFDVVAIEKRLMKEIENGY